MTTWIELFMYCAAGILIFGLICVVCAYNAWFSPHSYAAERKVFLNMVKKPGEWNNKYTDDRESYTENDALLGMASV